VFTAIAELEACGKRGDVAAARGHYAAMEALVLQLVSELEALDTSGAHVA
jgi:hypothetical protein